MKGNDSKEKVLNSVTRYMGLANLSIVAINPTAAEIQKILGLEELPKEPKYTEIELPDENSEDGKRLVNKVRLILRGKNLVMNEGVDGKTTFTEEVITATHDVFVSNKLVFSKTGKPKILNGIGIDTWQDIESLKSNPNMDWFTKYEPLHQAMEGEVELLQIFREFLNLGSKDECRFDNYENIAKGDVSELKRYISKWPNNALTVLLGVKVVDDKEYQVVYNKCFSRPSYKSASDKFIKALSEEYGEFKAIYSPDLKLRVYTKSLEVPDTESNSTSTSSWV
jgi:hypothetical protein